MSCINTAEKYGHIKCSLNAVLRQNLPLRIYSSTKTEDSMWLFILLMAHTVFSQRHPLWILVITQSSGCVVWHAFFVILGILQASLFLHDSVCDGITMGSSPHKHPSERQWIYPWENAYHTYIQAHNPIERAHVQKEFLPASALKQPCQSCLCY